MRIIAVDDEALQLETIVEYVQALYPHGEIHSFTRVSDALKYMETATADVAILDIDMPGSINGIGLGEMLRQKNPGIKLLYCTGYSHYAVDAYKIHANGYLQKPVVKEALRQELQYILQMPVFGDTGKPYIHTFGNFDVFAGSRPVVFRRSKSKEILAYLTDREGGWVTNRELIVMLWAETGTDAAFSKYITTLVNDMVLDLAAAGIAQIVERQRGKLRLRKEQVVCDYYGYLQGAGGFRGEYMSQYSWGESTLGALLSRSSVK